MLFESVSALEQPKAGIVVLQGRHFVIFAGSEAGPDSFKLLIVGSSVNRQGRRSGSLAQLFAALR
jgi:hypothetical protein